MLNINAPILWQRPLLPGGKDGVRNVDVSTVLVRGVPPEKGAAFVEPHELLVRIPVVLPLARHPGVQTGAVNGQHHTYIRW